MQVMIGVDPHKATHTAVAINGQRGRTRTARRCEPLEPRSTQLLGWAEPFPRRTWAIEAADGLGYLLAQQLVAAGETVRRCARHVGGPDPGVGHGPVEQERPQRRPVGRDHRAAPRRSASGRPVGHADVLRLLAKRNPTWAGTEPGWCVACTRCWSSSPRAGSPRKSTHPTSTGSSPRSPRRRPIEQIRYDLAVELLDDIRRLDDQLKASHKTDPHRGRRVGHDRHRHLRGRPDHRRHPHRLHRRHRPVRQPRPLRGLQRDRPGRVLLRRADRPPGCPGAGTVKLNHALHMAAICQIRQPTIRRPRATSSGASPKARPSVKRSAR